MMVFSFVLWSLKICGFLYNTKRKRNFRSYSFLFVFEYCCELEWLWLFFEEDGIYFVFSYYENWSNCESRTPQCGCRCSWKGFIYSWIICVSYGYERTIYNLLCSVTPSTFNTQIYAICFVFFEVTLYRTTLLCTLHLHIKLRVTKFR